MPRTAIVYYSRTGTTQTVAQALGAALDARILPIKCPRYQGGWLRYLLAGYDSVKGRLPDIEAPAIPWADYDLVVLGAPIWTSYPALPLRSFLDRKPGLPRRVALFLTHGGHSAPQKAIDMVSSFLPAPLVATLGLQQKDVENNRFDAPVADFVRKLMPDRADTATGP